MAAEAELTAEEILGEMADADAEAEQAVRNMQAAQARLASAQQRLAHARAAVAGWRRSRVPVELTPPDPPAEA